MDTYEQRYAKTGGSGVFINSITTGVNEIFRNQIDFDIYPNPFSTTAMIDFKGYESGKLVLKIYDVVGQLVQQIKIEGSCVIGREELKSGVYFWEVVDETDQICSRRKYLISIFLF